MTAGRHGRFEVGRFRVRTVEFGTIRLDGGSMFGSAPKPLWSTWHPADDRNRILLSCRGLLVESDETKLLVDAGCGAGWEPAARDRYDVVHDPGAAPSGVTDVLLTHLHFDHAAGLLENVSGSPARLAYPGARLHVGADNLARAGNPGAKEKASYFPSVVAAVDASLPRLFGRDAEVFPGISVVTSDGHTPGLSVVRVADAGEVLYFPSDLLPTAAHLHPAVHMGYDVCAETLLREKAGFLERAADERAVVVLQHEPGGPGGRIVRDGAGKYLFLE